MTSYLSSLSDGTISEFKSIQGSQIVTVNRLGYAPSHKSTKISIKHQWLRFVVKIPRQLIRLIIAYIVQRHHDIFETLVAARLNFLRKFTRLVKPIGNDALHMQPKLMTDMHFYLVRIWRCLSNNFRLCHQHLFILILIQKYGFYPFPSNGSLWAPMSSDFLFEADWGAESLR